MKKDSRIYVAGHTGLVGSAILRRLESDGYSNLIVENHAGLDLTRQSEVETFFKTKKPDYVFLAAAKVGGIGANNTYPANFIYDNLAIQTHMIHCAWKFGVKRLLFLGSSCIYPRDCPQPMKEAFLLTGPLEPTNEPYAIAKIAGIKMCQAYNRQYSTRFLSVMPTNLYGPNDNFDLEKSHVLPALIRKFHLAKLAARGEWEFIQADEKKYGDIPDDFRRCLVSISGKQGHSHPYPDEEEKLPSAVILWGSGNPRREFLHVDDLAEACRFMINLDDDAYNSLQMAGHPPLVNVGCGQDNSIKKLSEVVKNIVGFKGDVTFDATRPDGTPRKLMEISRIHQLGWKPRIGLKEGIQLTYQWYLTH